MVQQYDYTEPHMHDYHEVFFFFKQGGKHLMGVDEYEINQYSVHFLPAHFVHRLIRKEHVTGFTIGCSTLFLDQIQGFETTIDYHLFFTIPRVIDLSKEEFDSITYYIEEIEQQVQEDGYFLNLVSLVFQKVISTYKLDMDEKANLSDIANIIKLINENYKEKRSSLFYAKEMKKSVTSLNALCKCYFGKTIIQLQSDKILTEVKQVLVFTNKSISEIAYMFHFSDSSHLNHFFKKHTNKTPLEFRKTTIE